MTADLLRFRFDSFELDEANARLTRGGRPVPLPPRPFAVLCALARSPGMLVTKDALIDVVWGHRFVSESVLKTAISEVRAALGDDSKQPRYIETVSRRGYRFIATQASEQPQGASVLETVMSLCRSDAALADLICSVATALERERLALHSSNRFRHGQAHVM
jgi:DNA-binding winged helix-turn-helix (wHTH) protein